MVQIYQPLEGYCFNSDTLFLYDFISYFKPKKKVLEVGSGSGVLGLLLARDFPIELTQVEKQESFAKYTAKNADINKLDSTVIQQDFLDFHVDEKYDMIVSNPPFYHGGVVQTDNEMKKIARYNEFLPIRAFINQVNQCITPRGRFIFCYDPQELTQLLVTLLEYKFTVEDIRFVYPKEGKMASLVMLHARKGSKSMMKIHPPLFSFTKEEFSVEAQAIYAQTSTHSIKCEID